MPTATSLVREYTSQTEYEHDAEKLAKLGYVVTSVTEKSPELGWMQRLSHKLFASAQVRLVVSYSDQGMTA